MKPILKASILLILVMAVMAGCAKKPPVADLPQDLHLESVGFITPGSPVAWHPDGYRYAVASGGLDVRQLDGGKLDVDDTNPSAIAWSPTGSFLAASFARKATSSVQIYGSDGAAIANMNITGSVRDLVWSSDDELLLAAVVVQPFSFGANYTVNLHRWRQSEEMTHEIIADTSPLKSNLEAMGDSIYDSVHLQISPYRDEILFSRLVMPPNVELHYQLVIRHLESGREKVITRIPFGSSGGRYLMSEDKIFYSDGQYQSILRSIWGTEAYETFTPGLSLEISPGGLYKLIDQKFFRGRDVLFHLDNIDQAAFSPDGSRLLFTSGRTLYLLEDLEDSPVERRQASQRLLELRKWRSQGLLSPQEFNKYVRKLDKQ